MMNRCVLRMVNDYASNLDIVAGKTMNFPCNIAIISQLSNGGGDEGKEAFVGGEPAHGAELCGAEPSGRFVLVQVNGRGV